MGKMQSFKVFGSCGAGRVTCFFFLQAINPGDNPRQKRKWRDGVLARKGCSSFFCHLSLSSFVPLQRRLERERISVTACFLVEILAEENIAK
jgi:hypothetical protein